jgi:HK97 family phage major capsid protein
MENLMKNLDMLQQKKAEIAVKLNQAMKDGNEEAFQQAFTEYTDILQEAVMAEAKGLVQAADNTILAGRGVRALTSIETKYYEKVIEAMRSSDPKQALTLIDETLPTTVIDAVFDDITEAHPLLSEINFQNTGILTEILISNNDGRHLATWGKLCDTIVKELTAGTSVINLEQNKLSAFIPICKAMLEIGPVWIDRYVRTILLEAISNGLENAIIAGTGVDQPIGMMKDPNGVFHPQNGYPDLVAVPLSEITPETYGGILAALAVGPNGLYRTISEVLFICNPVDFYTKIMPAVMYRLPDGTWASRFPFPTKVIQSVYVPTNKAVIGIGRRYFFGLGTGKGGKIEYSDHYKFLEDDRYYLTKLYGDGKPLDSTSFKVVDITAIRPVAPIVRVADYVDARLSAMTLTDELTAAVNFGVFNENIHAYSAAIADDEVAGDNNVASLTVTANDPNAVIVVKNGSNVVTAANDAYALTLNAGANVITITSTVGATEQEAYVLVINYTPVA